MYGAQFWFMGGSFSAADSLKYVPAFIASRPSAKLFFPFRPKFWLLTRSDLWQNQYYLLLKLVFQIPILFSISLPLNLSSFRPVANVCVCAVVIHARVQSPTDSHSLMGSEGNNNERSSLLLGSKPAATPAAALSRGASVSALHQSQTTHTIKPKKKGGAAKVTVQNTYHTIP